MFCSRYILEWLLYFGREVGCACCRLQAFYTKFFSPEKDMYPHEIENTDKLARSIVVSHAYNDVNISVADACACCSTCTSIFSDVMNTISPWLLVSSSTQSSLLYMCREHNYHSVTLLFNSIDHCCCFLAVSNDKKGVFGYERKHNILLRAVVSNWSAY